MGTLHTHRVHGGRIRGDRRRGTSIRPGARRLPRAQLAAHREGLAAFRSRHRRRGYTLGGGSRICREARQGGWIHRPRSALEAARHRGAQTPGAVPAEVPGTLAVSQRADLAGRGPGRLHPVGDVRAHARRGGGSRLCSRARRCAGTSRQSPRRRCLRDRSRRRPASGYRVTPAALRPQEPAHQALRNLKMQNHAPSTARATSLIADLAAHTRSCYSLDQRFYCDDEVFAADMREIVMRKWIVAGHVDQVRRKGDYFLFKVGREAIIIVRSDETTINAFYNVCRHRGSVICTEPHGRVTRLTCPYHAWSYGLDGALLA